MVSEGYRADLNKALRLVAVKLDLDETRYRNAEEKYKAIGNWLNADNSNIKKYSPQVYSQGSFLLGTVVKPLSGEEYDIDLVCELCGLSRESTSQSVKKLVGDRLRENQTYSQMLTPMNRCWRLNYAGEFHMDIIPAIPDAEKSNGAILIPDSEIADWEHSNPKGYADWFLRKMHAEFAMQRMTKSIEEVPDFMIKTSLQQSVQLMKRHRDIMFADDEKNKPISIIISTLAARAYLDKGDLYETLRGIVAGIPNHITERDGVPWIENPSNPDENFADKWPKHPKRREAFYEWGEKLQEDIERLGECTSLEECEDILKELFGVGVVSNVMKEMSQERQVSVGKSKFDVPHRQDPSSKWTVANVNSAQVKIRGYIKRGETRVEEFQSDSPDLDKHLSIHFLAETHNIDRPYEVHWQVVNTGEEAAAIENNKGLRGDFYEPDSHNSHKREERTEYRGMHWIEAFIIRNGVCIARSGEFVVNIK